MVIDPEKKRTLRNWVGDGVVTATKAKQLIDGGQVPKPKALKDDTLIRYADLVAWGAIEGDGGN